MKEIFFLHLSNLIQEKTGVKIGEDKKEIFLKSLLAKSSLASKLDFDKYALYLKDKPIQLDTEWKLIFQILNISETYFFRDKSQIEFIKNSILPQIINKNRDSKKIRIWSAGCSTGEEAYTISFLIQDLLMDIRSWNLQILATDINIESIEKAKKAEYYDWSFRGLDKNILPKYFDTFKDKYIVKPEYRYYIKFQQENLLHSFLRNEIDFILCRNVFIYMQSETVSSILNVFAKALKESSFFVAGHNEINCKVPEELKPFIINGNTGYEKRTINEVKKNNIPEQNLPKKINTIEKKPLIPNLPKILRQKNTENEVLELNTALDLADKGNFTEAKTYCKKILYLNPNNFEANHLMGQILESESSFEESISFYKRSILLNKRFLEAYLALASVYSISGKISESQEVRKKGLELFLTDETLRKEYEMKGFNLKNFESFFKDESSTWV